MLETTGVSHYDALQASLKRRPTSLDFLFSCTFSKSIDGNSGAPTNELYALPGDQQNRMSQRGVSDFDRTHRLVANFVWAPKKVYFGDSKIAQGLLNDWQFSGIVTVQSGIRFSVISTSGAAIYDRADLVRAGNQLDQVRVVSNDSGAARGLSEISEVRLSSRAMLIVFGRSHCETA